MEAKRHNIYMPLDLYEKIKILAGIKRRSVNQQCIDMLSNFFILHPDESKIINTRLKEEKEWDDLVDIPMNLREKIRYLANKDFRSFNQECIVLLAYAIEQRRDELKEEKQEEKDSG